MNAQPLVAVAIPARNNGKFLAQSLKSILRQTYGCFKLFVVDMASEDDTSKIVSSIRDPRLNYVRYETAEGLAKDWNRAIEVALREPAEFVALFHADDLYAPTLLEAEVSMLEKHPEAGFVHAAQYYHDAEENRLVPCRPYSEDRIIGANDLWNEIAEKGFYHISTPCVLMRREATEKAGFFDTRFKIAPDLDLWWRIMENYKMGYISEPLLVHRVHPGQMSSSNTAQFHSIKETQLILEKALEAHSRRDPFLPKEKILGGIRRYGARGHLSIARMHLACGRFSLALQACREAARLDPGPSTRLKASLLRLLSNSPGRLIWQRLKKLNALVRGDLQGLPAWAL
ncbi:MAG: glycosyltransferase [Elusimicrobia bacterium]|nr:glycosyltransferase [Elusimicrobiota bacterium]